MAGLDIKIVLGQKREGRNMWALSFGPTKFLPKNEVPLPPLGANSGLTSDIFYGCVDSLSREVERSYQGRNTFFAS